MPTAQRISNKHRRHASGVERPPFRGATAASPPHKDLVPREPHGLDFLPAGQQDLLRTRCNTGFTPFVRRLAAGHSPSDTDVAAVLLTLRGALIGALRRRGLWFAPPSVVGVIGHSHWTHRGRTVRSDNEKLCLDDAVGELLTECYLSIFVQRLPRLQAHLALKSNIDGLVFLNLRHFLSEKQRKHDPLGYRILRILRTSLRTLSRSGLLYVLDGPETITNTTILGFRASGSTLPTPQSRLATVVASWADHLTQPIALATASGVTALADELGTLLPRLEDHGVTCFRVRDLAQALQRAIRVRWAARSTETGPVGFEQIDGVATAVATVQPSHSFEDRAAFEALQQKIRNGIDQLNVKPKVRRYLHTLSAYLGAFATDRPTALADHDAQRDAAMTPSNTTLPSYRKLGATLGIPRERLPELFETLQTLTQQPSTVGSRRIAERPTQRQSPSPGTLAKSV